MSQLRRRRAISEKKSPRWSFGRCIARQIEKKKPAPQKSLHILRELDKSENYFENLNFEVHCETNRSQLPDPVYGHTLESLKKGDASFSLTVMGLERSSMQPIFHLEVCLKNVLLASKSSL